jgi:hypothetical protein
MLRSTVLCAALPTVRCVPKKNNSRTCFLTGLAFGQVWTGKGTVLDSRSKDFSGVFFSL